MVPIYKGRHTRGRFFLHVQIVTTSKVFLHIEKHKARIKILIGREERQAVWLADLAASCLRSRSDLVGLSGSAQSTAQLRARRTAVGAKAAISEQIQQIRRTGYPAHSLHCQDKTKVKGGRHQHGSRRSTPATPPDFGSPRLH